MDILEGTLERSTLHSSMLSNSADGLAGLKPRLRCYHPETRKFLGLDYARAQPTALKCSEGGEKNNKGGSAQNKENPPNFPSFLLLSLSFLPLHQTHNSSTFPVKIHHKTPIFHPSSSSPSSYLCLSLFLLRESEGGRRITTLHLLYSFP